MISDIFPVGLNSPGNNMAIYVTTPPVVPTAPTLAELNAGLDVTCYLQADFWDGLGFGQERDDDTRACDASKREGFGVETWGLNEISHIVSPQALGSVTGNLAKSKIVVNSLGYLYVRSGVAHTTGLVAAQIINNGFSVTTGAAAELPRASGKYLRTVQVSLSRIVTDYAVPAA